MTSKQSENGKIWIWLLFMVMIVGAGYIGYVYVSGKKQAKISRDEERKPGKAVRDTKKLTCNASKSKIPDRREEEIFRAILAGDKTQMRSSLQDYLRQYPRGKFIAQARKRLTNIEEGKEGLELQKAISYKDIAEKARALEGFLARYPGGKNEKWVRVLLREAREILEERDFKKMMERIQGIDPQQGQEAFQKFLDHYPGGKYFRRVEAKIAEIEKAEENKAFQQALSYIAPDKKRKALEKFLDIYPSGEHRKQATAALKKLHSASEKREFQVAMAQSRQTNYRQARLGLQKYLDEHLRGTFVNQAHIRLVEIDRLEENQAFQEATSNANPKKSVYALQTFLTHYPNGYNSHKANELLRELQKEYVEPIAEELLRLSRLQMKKHLYLQGADSNVLDLLHLSRISWNSDKRRQAIAQARMACSKAPPGKCRDNLEALLKYFYLRQIDKYVKTSLWNEAAALSREAVSMFPDSERIGELAQKTNLEDIPPTVRQFYHKAMLLQEQENWQQAIAIYQGISGANKHYREQIEQKIAECKSKAFSDYDQQARKAYQSSDNFACLDAILQAEKFKADKYWSTLKPKIEQAVYLDYFQRIQLCMEKKDMAKAKYLLAEVKQKYPPKDQWGNRYRKQVHIVKLADLFTQALQAYRDQHYSLCISLCEKGLEGENSRQFQVLHLKAKAQLCYRKGNFWECTEICENALKNFPDEDEFDEMMSKALGKGEKLEKSRVIFNEARHHVSQGRVSKAESALRRINKISGLLPEIENLQQVWFMQMAASESSSLLDSLVYKVPNRDLCVLDMSSEAWEKLSRDNRIRLASLYQKIYAKQLQKALEKNFDCGGASITMRLIPPGRFWMGSSEQHSPDEKPRHRVVITRPFWLGKYEITQKQWKITTGEQPWREKPYVRKDSAVAANYITWENIQQKIIARIQGFALPTEAQWEYACRAGTLDRFYWGNGEIDDYAYSKESQSGNWAHFPGQKKPNGWGLCDMSGNVYEWCQDWYRDSYANSQLLNPSGPAEGLMRVRRGGCWTNYRRNCRSAYRFYGAENYPDHTTGFRLLHIVGKK